MIIAINAGAIFMFGVEHNTDLSLIWDEIGGGGDTIASMDLHWMITTIDTITK